MTNINVFLIQMIKGYCTCDHTDTPKKEVVTIIEDA